MIPKWRVRQTQTDIRPALQGEIKQWEELFKRQSPTLRFTFYTRYEKLIILFFIGFSVLMFDINRRAPIGPFGEK